jgi:hypothetical protein
MAGLQKGWCHMASPILNIVPEAIGAWLSLPDSIAAPAPADRTKQTTFRLAAGDITKMTSVARRQLTFELWSCVMGVPPPVPGCGHRNQNVAAGTLMGLKDAHALFQGIERPLAEDDNGAGVLAFIVKPTAMYEYDSGSLVSVALKIVVPQDVVFVVYVRLDNPDAALEDMTGTVTHWGFVEADKNDPTLPVEYDSRYRKRLW